MKRDRALYLVGILILVAATATAITSTAQRNNNKSGPRMEIEPSDHDFGGVKPNQELLHVFTVSNVGTEPLEIRRISTSCGCTAAIAKTRVLNPGQSTTLEVTLETRKYKGVIEKSVSVASNDPARVHTIRVKAFVEVPEPR
jgi:hypothetical protein